MRRTYIVTYDISDPRRLRRVYRTMRGFGEHLQLSVFCCDLTASDRVRMIAALEAIVLHGEDQVILVDLGLTSAGPIKAMEALGRPLQLKGRIPVIV
ncbi:MAG TPA: CRISPR-associated endonuclease Cas2 [Myxococcales bacterium]|nr:CRISPR-associated endonuclease Cas2 [Myxococcales bacterium]